jgi:hypothetical protein
MERESLLPERVRQAIDSGKLPARKPDRVLGGLGTGKLCVVCGGILTPTQMEIEAEFDRGGTSPGADRYWAHPRCFAAWELELRGRQGGGVVDGTVTPERHTLPTWSPDAPLDRGEPRP